MKKDDESGARERTLYMDQTEFKGKDRAKQRRGTTIECQRKSKTRRTEPNTDKTEPRVQFLLGFTMDGKIKLPLLFIEEKQTWNAVLMAQTFSYINDFFNETDVDILS